MWKLTRKSRTKNLWSYLDRAVSLTELSRTLLQLYFKVLCDVLQVGKNVVTVRCINKKSSAILFVYFHAFIPLFDVSNFYTFYSDLNIHIVVVLIPRNS